MEEASGSPLDLWPENLKAYNVFVVMATQWMTAGMSGVRTGLNYASLPMAWEAFGVKKKERVETFEALRVMEDAALTYFQRLREAEAKKGN